MLALVPNCINTNELLEKLEESCHSPIISAALTPPETDPNLNSNHRNVFNNFRLALQSFSFGLCIPAEIMKVLFLLLQSFPEIARMYDDDDNSLLSFAVMMDHYDVELIRRLASLNPASITHVGTMYRVQTSPLLTLLYKDNLDYQLALELIRAYPGACRVPGTSGHFPLHLVISPKFLESASLQSGQIQFIRELVHSFPQALLSEVRQEVMSLLPVSDEEVLFRRSFHTQSDSSDGVSPWVVLDEQCYRLVPIQKRWTPVEILQQSLLPEVQALCSEILPKLFRLHQRAEWKRK